MSAGEQVGSIPAGGGVYVLVLRRRPPAVRATVGALGAVLFEPGYYCYVGSARAGLRARLERHLRREGKRRRWHIDYLRELAEPVAALCWTGRGVGECELSRRVRALADEAVAGFGSSDCRCASHLYWFGRDPVARLARLRPDGAGRAMLVRFGPAREEQQSGRAVRPVRR